MQNSSSGRKGQVQVQVPGKPMHVQVPEGGGPGRGRRHCAREASGSEGLQLQDLTDPYLVCGVLLRSSVDRHQPSFANSALLFLHLTCVHENTDSKATTERSG